ncbi:MAG: GGDEF domain-containing protein [Candidatus Dormiibacterota bacterium]
MELSDAEATRWRRALDAAGIGCWEWCPDDRLSIDDRLAGWLGSPPPATMTALRALVDPATRAALAEAQDRIRRAPGELAVTRYRIRAGDRWRWLEERAVSHPHLVVGACRDVTDELRRERAAIWRAEHDGLTGLHDRASFLRLLRGRVRTPAQAITVVAIDLDRLKSVNDDHGHRAGDRLLTAAARRLRTAIRADDVIARLGGDEFGVLVEGDPDGTLGAAIAVRLLESLRQPLELGERRIELGASAGVAVHRAGEQPQALLERADRALYGAKQAGRGRWQLAL